MEELVVEAKHGNKEAYSELCKLVESDLLKLARSILKNEIDCQDVVQDTFIIAYMRLSKLKDNKKFQDWISQILINNCKRIYRKNKHHYEELLENEHSYPINDEDNVHSRIDFDRLIECLGKKDKEIFKLRYEDDLTIKEVSKIVDMNENTVKSRLWRGQKKMKKLHSKAGIFVFILCLVITAGVAAACIISYIKGLFKIDIASRNNDGVLMAIENLNWYQEVDMDYIDLGDGYKIKVEYLLMDEMNLYLVFDLQSEENISKYIDLAFPDLKILNENGDIICDRKNQYSPQYNEKLGDKTIEHGKHNIKSLFYMYTNSFPMSKTLDISFSEICLSKKLNTKELTNIKAHFKIDLSDKFINRNCSIYISKESEIEKAIITETGFYAVLNSSNRELPQAMLLDIHGNLYKCYCTSFTDTVLKYLITANFNNVETQTLKLILDNKEFELTRKTN